MSEDSPLVSVVIPTHNRAEALRRALRSVVAQTHKNLEVIIVDDASKDHTAEIVASFFEYSSKYIRHETNRGACVSRNAGIKAAVGDYIAFLDSDDEWQDDHISNKLITLDRNCADGVFGGYVLSRGPLRLTKKLAPWPPKMPVAEYILSSFGGDVRTSTMLFKREAVANILFDDKLRKHQDWDIAIRFAKKYKLVKDENATVIMHTSNKDRMSARMNHVATRMFIETHRGEICDVTAANFYRNIAIATRRIEGRNEHFFAYLNEIWKCRGVSLADSFYCGMLRAPLLDIIAINAKLFATKLRQGVSLAGGLCGRLNVLKAKS